MFRVFSVSRWFKPQRHGIKRVLPAACLIFALSSTTASQRSPAPSARPNLLLITIDTLRADRLGSYGYKPARTPILDALAREGVRFERAFSPVPLTLPAHASILTGVYPSFHGVRDNSGFVLSPEHTTLAEILKKAGYQTAAFVGAFVLDSKFGLDQGFDYYHDNFDLSRYENISPGYIQRTGDEVVRETTGWLESQVKNKRPFFVWTHLYDPHDPYTPPEPYRSQHPGSPYDGEIEFTDFNVGALLRWLRQNGVYDDTLVVVVGDHGESLGEHGESKHGFFLYNAALHVPLIFKLPGGKYAGRAIADSVSSVDIFSSILQVFDLGRTEMQKAQGKGFLSLILGKNPSYRAELYAETYYPRLQFGWSEIRAVITNKYKYLLLPEPELYDLEQDFVEKNDLASDRSVVANQMRATLKTLIRRYNAPAGASKSKTELDPETREKLRSLGYISYSMGDLGSDEVSNLHNPRKEIETYNEIVSLFELGSQGDYRAVIPRYERILKAQPTLKIVQYKLAQAYFQTGNYEAALAGYKKAIELGGDAALATYDLALTYLKLGRAADAVLGFQRTVELDPAHHRARTNLGLLLKNQGKFLEAIQQLEAAIKLAPRSLIALNNLGIAYSMAGRNQEAEATLRSAIEIAPKDGLVRANLAAVLHRMGRAEEARQEMEQARKLDSRIGAPRP